MGRSFRGGVHPPEKKELSRECPVKVLEPKGELVIPVGQHIGKPAKILVKKGDRVKVGEKIADFDGYVSADIHSSVSGTVKAVEKRRTIAGTLVESAVIENDGLYEAVEGYGEVFDYSGISNKELLWRIREAGIVGMGGAAFPTPVKLEPKHPEDIRYVIVNGVECEPYITCDDQLMRTKAPEIVEGLQIILRLFPNAEGVILIEENKPEAIEAMKKAVSGKNGLRVQTAPVKYPQGGERAVIKVVAGVDTKLSELPADAGCIVDNAATVFAIYEAVKLQKPLIRRIVTVSGEAVAEPANYLVRIGTKAEELLEASGGCKEGAEIKKVLAGGPMMGVAFGDLEAPIQKGNNALTFLASDEVAEADEKMTACLRCGRCATVCPMGLVPEKMADAAEKKDLERFEKKFYGLECIACGSCTFICPAKRPLTQLFKEMKARCMQEKRMKAAAAAKGGKA